MQVAQTILLLALTVAACTIPVRAWGQAPGSEGLGRNHGTAQVTEPTQAERDRPWVGGHVNLALPLVEFRTGHKEFDDGEGPGRAVLAIGRDFGTLGLAPGITVHLNKRWAIDFEFVAYSDWKNDITSVVFDPGVWYKFDKITLGLRTAVHIGQPPNWGLIPILIKGWPVGLVNLFVELDLPMFITDRDSEGGPTTFGLTFQPQFGVSF